MRRAPGGVETAQGGKHIGVHRGCCPAAVAVYAQRPGYRCCAHKTDRLLPLRPVGGLSWEQFADALPRGQLLLLDGDSMVTQQFVGLLCLAWATPGFTIASLTSVPSVKLGQHQESWAWVAEVVRGCDAEPRVNTTGCWWVTLIHWHALEVGAQKISLPAVANGTPMALGSSDAAATPSTLIQAKSVLRWLANDQAAAMLASVAVTIVGGWQHQLPSYEALVGFMRRLSTDPVLGHQRTVFVEAIPPHFPGGHYIVMGYVKYPPAEPPEQACNQWHRPQHDAGDASHLQKTLSRNATPPTFIRGISNDWIDRFNVWLEQAVEDGASALPSDQRRKFHLQRVAALYAGRGDANVDSAGEANHYSQRDCLHLCVAPGVLDALAMETLWTLAQVIGPSERAPVAVQDDEESHACRKFT